MRIKRTTPRNNHARRIGLIAATSALVAGAAIAAPTAYAGSDTSRTFTAAEAKAAGDAVLKADIGGTAWYVDKATNKLVVTADSTVSQDEIAEIKATAGANAGAIEINRTPGKMQKLIAGGEAITTGGARCSLGFNVQDSAGTKYAVTAGHCTNIGSSWSIGTRAGTSFPGNDYGIIRHSNGSAADGRVYLYNGSYQDITRAANPSNGASACRSGSTTGVHCGNVTGLNATVNYGSDGIVYGLIQTNICAEPGDSGGSLYSGSTAYGLTSGGSGNCSSGGTTFFQPVVEALNAYGVNVF